MRKHLALLFAFTLLIIISCQEKAIPPNEEIEVIQQFSQLEEQIKEHDSKVLVLNFWATTCPPCIKEMPHFKELEDNYPSDQLKILLVNLDLPRDFEKRVLPFVKKHEIVPEVLMLTDANYSAWTDKIDSSWYGALPATLITYKGGKKIQIRPIRILRRSRQ